MSLSLTPSFGENYWPSAPNWSSWDRDFDRDMQRMQRAIEGTTDRHGVHHRQPNYTYEENEESAYLEVELPGVPKENVNVDLEGKSLIITAKRFKPGATVHVHVTSADEPHEEKPEGNGEPEVEHTKEAKPSVQYDLKLRVGNKYDAEKITATMEGDGLLKMEIPLKHKDTTRPIQIQSANM